MLAKYDAFGQSALQDCLFYINMAVYILSWLGKWRILQTRGVNNETYLVLFRLLFNIVSLRFVVIETRNQFSSLNQKIIVNFDANASINHWLLSRRDWSLESSCRHIWNLAMPLKRKLLHTAAAANIEIKLWLV